MSSLKGKTILITGASAGFGKATAEALAREGAQLILTGRRVELLQDLAKTLKVKTHVARLDVRDMKSIETLIAGLPKEFQAIDVLVNNAGLALGLSSADQSDMNDWQTMIDTNILGLITMTRKILPGMKERKTGHIVNISSIAGTYHYAGGHVYGATKAFVTYFSLALRADLLGHNIRVTNIEPGMAETEFSEVRFKGDKAKAKTVYKGVTPLSAADIAESVRWALSQPAHVNINRIEIMPTMQAPVGLAVHRE